MHLRFATLKALVSAGLMAAFCLVTKAQSNTEQSILFSTPDGQSISNALLPSVQAPGTPQGLPDLPGNEQSFSFNPQARQRMPLPRPTLKQRNKSQDDNTDIRKSMGVLTPAEAMGVPSLQELFGLPKPKATNSMSQYGGDDTGSTNTLTSEGAAASDANWAKILSADSDAFNMAKTADSNRLTGALFDSAANDSLFREKKANNEKADDEKPDNDFNTSSFARAYGSQPGQGAWEAAVQIAAPANVPAYTPPAPAPSGFGVSSLNSQSPFTLPKVSTPETSMPHLPTLPSASWQNPPSQPATPSWAPKPPPWLDSTPPLGTMAQRKF
jgi:hypothetical protein